MDSARTIKRLGAKSVTVIYRRSEKQMPAEIKEIEDAKKDGVEFLFQNNIVKILGKTNVEKIELEILGKNEKINNVEPVIIGKEELKDESYEDIEKILIEKYAIKKENIIIK